jgi:RNA recognition motif-containing protein
MNIYVGNLSRTTTEDDLRNLFAEYGEVSSVNILKDRYTNEPRGFGFVEMPGKDEAMKAIAELNGAELGGRSLTINEARPRTDNRGGGGGGRGPGGGNRGGGGGGRRRY